MVGGEGAAAVRASRARSGRSECRSRLGISASRTTQTWRSIGSRTSSWSLASRPRPQIGTTCSRSPDRANATRARCSAPPRHLHLERGVPRQWSITDSVGVPKASGLSRGEANLDAAASGIPGQANRAIRRSRFIRTAGERKIPATPPSNSPARATGQVCRERAKPDSGATSSRS